MITEIPVSDLKKADKAVRENWPSYILWRHDKQVVLEAWGCDTEEEVQQKWEELTQKEGTVVVNQYRPRSSTVN